MINVHMIIVTNKIPHKTGPPASKKVLISSKTEINIIRSRALIKNNKNQTSLPLRYCCVLYIRGCFIKLMI
jgi:hypothetical protein